MTVPTMSTNNDMGASNAILDIHSSIMLIQSHPLDNGTGSGTSAELEDDYESSSLDFSQVDVQQEDIGEEPRSIILGMLSQVTKGMDLHRITFPTFVLEPRSMLERITDFMSHPQLILG